MFNEEIVFLKALANGVNLFTGERCENDSILNDTNVVRTLFNICEKLSELKDVKIKKTPFEFNTEMLNSFEYEDRNMSLTDIIKKIELQYPNMQKLKYTQIYDVLHKKGILDKITSNGKSRTIATEKAKQFGISNVQKTSMYGQTYTTVAYNRQGQQYVLSILNEIE